MPEQVFAVYHVAFAGRAVEIICDTPQAHAVCNALFQDIPQQIDVKAHHEFRIVTQSDELRLTSADATLYQGNSKADLAGFLVGEVIYHLCDHADSGLMLHAAALYRDDITLVMPAESGSGKTTLTGYLLSQGFRYLTDELVHVALGTNTIEAFTRPLNFKRPAFDVIRESIGIDCEASDSLAGSWASLVPHRNANPHYRWHTPELTHIVFPRYSRDEEPELSAVSSARAAMYLMGCLVNARNLDGHGFDEATRIARKVNAVSVRYQNFEQVSSRLMPWFSETQSASASVL